MSIGAGFWVDLIDFGVACLLFEAADGAAIDGLAALPAFPF
jgi:hypothetical protein